MTTVQYSYNFILDLLNNNKSLLDNTSLLSKFSDIVKQNKFNPKKYVKKFNYTNWRNAFKKEDEAKKNTDDIIIEKINLLLNKISKQKFEVLSEKITTIIGDNKTYLNYSINQLFKLATAQHLLTNVYSDLCLLLEEKYTSDKINIKNIILAECKSNYHGYNKMIDKITEEKSEDDTEYDILCKINKCKKRLIGIFHFVGDLFIKNLVEDIVIYKYLELLYNNLNDNTLDVELREQYVLCLKELLTNTGKKLNKNDAEKFTINVLDKIKLFNKDTKFNNREKFMFMDILDLF